MRRALIAALALASIALTADACKKPEEPGSDNAAGPAAQAGQAVDDAATTAKVKSKLAADPTVAAYTIDVDTQNGVVTLNGHVDSGAAKAQAEKVARDTEGVSDVVVALVADAAAPTPTP
jgi:osmotically-inducible protein OsmY